MPPTEIVPPNQSSAASDHSTLRFRRIHLPLAKILEQSGNPHPYLPMDADEFEERINRLKSTVSAPPHSTSQITAARYEAILDDRDQWVGDGQWTVKHSAATPAMLTVEPCRLAISSPYWNADDPEGRSPASLGMDSTGNVTLRVDRSRELHFQWSLRGTIGDMHDVSYEFAVPRAPFSELLLHAPTGRALIADGGALSETESAHENMRAYRILFRGDRPLKLKVLPAGRSNRARSLNILRPSLRYDIKPSGMQLTAHFRLDIHGETLRQLRVEFDSELDLLQAQLGDDNLHVSLVDASDGRRQALIHLPEPLSGVNQQLRLTAVAPLVMDHGWRLPRIAATHVVTEDAKTTLVIESPLRLTNLALVDCRQLSREQTKSPAAETVELECLSSDCQVELELQAQIDRLRYTSASIIDAQPNEAKLRYTCDLSCDEGEQFQLAASVSPNWIIDDVTASPADMMTDWEVVRSGPTAGRLLVHLGKSLNPDRSLRLIVTAQRRRAPLRDTLRAGDFSLLTFPGLKPTRHLAMIHTDANHRLDIQPAYAITPLEPAELDPSEKSILAAGERGFAFLLDDRAEDLELRLSPVTPQLSAEIDVQSTVSDEGLSESYSIACNVGSNQLHQILVHFTSPRETEPEWTLDGQSNSVAAQRLDAEVERRLGLSGSGETWQLRFRTPINQRFVLKAKRTSSLSDRPTVALVSLPEATSQRGTVTVRSRGTGVFALKHQRLRAIPPQLPESDRGDQVLGSFQFDPPDEAQRDSDFELVRHSDAKPSAWVWNCSGHTWLSISGPVRHSARFAIESSGLAAVQLQLGAVVGEPRVLIDGSHESRVTFDSKHARLTLPLPTNQRSCTVLLEWTTTSLVPSALLNLAIHPPEADIPMLARRWTVWLPADYDLLNAQPESRPAGQRRLNWQRRLFGGLARTADQETFEPWMAHDWALLGRQLTQRSIHLETADAFFARLDASDSLREWGARIDEAWREAAAADQPLLIEFTALDRLGIDANATQHSPHSNALPVAANRELVLLFHDSVSILTTRYSAAEFLGSSIATSPSRVFRFDDALSERIADEHGSSPFGALCSLEAWRSLARDNAIDTKTDADDFDLRAPGWTPHSIELTDDRELQLLIVQRPYLIAVGYASMLIAAAAGFLLPRRRQPTLRLAMLGAAAILALLIPEPWIPLGSGVFLGLSFGFAAHAVAQRGVRQPESPSAIVAVAPARTLPVAVLVVVSLVASQLRAIEHDSIETTPIPVFDVLVPSDDGNESGNRVYLPEPFYKELIRLSPSKEPNDGNWLITQARYETLPTENSAQNRAVWVARYRLDVFDSSRVRLPLGRDGAHLLPLGAMLDEKPLPFEWDGAQKEIAFDVPQAGAYKLDVEFVPAPQVGAAPLINFSIPAVPDSRLTLGTLPGLMRPLVNGFGSITASTGADGLVCELGPVDQITIHNADPVQTPQPPEFEATEILWLRAGPGTLHLNGRWQITVNRGTLHHLTMQLDPAAHLLPPGDNSPISRMTRMNDGHRVQLDFREPVTDSTIFELPFVLEPPPSPGRIAFPLTGLLGAKQTRRILAASSTPQIELQTFPIPEAKVLSATEFALLWPPTDIRPRWIVEVPNSPGEWPIQIGPRPSTISATYKTIAAARRAHVDVHWLADIQINGEPRHSFQIRAPESFAVTNVNVRDAAGARASRWTRNQSGDVSVLLESPMVGEAQLRLSGSVALPAEGDVAVPRLSLRGAASQQDTLFLARRTNTSVAFANPAELEQLSPEDLASQYSDLARQLEIPDREPGDRLVAAFATEPTVPFVLRVTPNRPETDAVQVMTVERSDAGWMATLDAEISVTGGTLDELRFKLPESWRGPFSIDPSMPSDVLELPGGTRLLVIQPAMPLTGTARLRIRGPLNTRVGQPLRIPEVQLDGARTSGDYLALPTKYNLQQLAWDTRGLAEEPLLKSMESSRDQPGLKTYSRAAPRATAELKSIEKLADDPQVRFADLALAWHADRSCYGVASFDLEPAGAESCLLALPEEFDLVYLAIDGMPQLRQPVANLRWRVSLASARLPLRIDVVYRGRLPDSPHHVPHHALSPWLVGLPVEKTLWTVSGPRFAGLPTVDEQSPLPDTSAEIARLDAIGSLIKSAATSLVEQTTPDIARWYRPWFDRWRQARGAAKRLDALSLSNTNSTDVPQQLARAESEQMQFARQIQAWTTIEPIWSKTPPAEGQLRAWQRSLDRSHPNAHAVIAGAAHAPSLKYPRAFAGDWGIRVGQAAVACVIVLLFAWAIRATPLPNWLARSPQAAIIAFGLFWWLFLAPSAVGWMIVALGVFGPRIDRSIGFLRRRNRPLPSAK